MANGGVEGLKRNEKCGARGTIMYAVSISLGSASAIVAVSSVTSSSAAAESSATIRVTANSSGHRVTPMMAAFSENNEVLFGEDARALYTRSPQVVVPYLFSFVAAAHRRQRLPAAEGDPLVTDIEAAAQLHYKGHCPLQREENDSTSQCGFRPHSDDGSGATNCDFLSGDEMLVKFFDHVKRHTVDGACGLTATDSVGEKATPNGTQTTKIVLTVVVPRYLFPEVVVSRGKYSDEPKNDCGEFLLQNDTDRSADVDSPARKTSELQWVEDAIKKSHFGPVSEHISIIFADEAALLGMDALACKPHFSHRMAGCHFLLPSTAAQPAGETTPWPAGRVLVVDWGALGVSLTSLCLKGGCLLSDTDPKFLRASYTMSASLGTQNSGFYSSPSRCGGGDAVNIALHDCLAKNFIQQQRRVLGYQSLNDFPPRSRRRLLMAVEEKKIALSRAAQLPVEIEALAEGVDMRDNVTFSRTRVNALLRGEWGILEAFEKVTRDYLELLSNKEEEPFDVVVLCGGMLQMPYVAQSLRQLFMQYAAGSPGDRRYFSRNLAVMEASLCTTMMAACDDSDGWNGGPIPTQTAENNGNVGAEEIFCVGGCLHSFHIAFAAMQRAELQSSSQSAKGKKNVGGGKNTQSSLTWQKHRRLEETRRVWRTLTRGMGDIYNDGVITTTKVAVLQRSILLLTPAGVEELSKALTQQRETGSASLVIPQSALTVLFAHSSVVPARVVVPVLNVRQSAIVMYLFSEETEEVCGAATTDSHLSLEPLTDSGLVLQGLTCEEQWKHYVVFTLRPCEDMDGGNSLDISNDNVGDVSKGSKQPHLRMVAQLVRVTADACEPLVVRLSNVCDSVTVDL